MPHSSPSNVRWSLRFSATEIYRFVIIVKWTLLSAIMLPKNVTSSPSMETVQYYVSKTAAFVVSNLVLPCCIIQNHRHLFNTRNCINCHQGGHIQLTRYRLDHHNTSLKTITFHSIPTFSRIIVPHRILFMTPTGDDNSDRECQRTGPESWIRYLLNMYPSNRGATQTSSRSHAQSRIQCGHSTGLNCRTDEPSIVHWQPS
jgi:hypothetical protein